MTEADLIADLDALLEAGYVMADLDEFNEEDRCFVPRFRLTKRGQFVYLFDRLPAGREEITGLERV